MRTASIQPENSLKDNQILLRMSCLAHASETFLLISVLLIVFKIPTERKISDGRCLRGGGGGRSFAPPEFSPLITS